MNWYKLYKIAEIIENPNFLYTDIGHLADSGDWQRTDKQCVEYIYVYTKGQLIVKQVDNVDIIGHVENLSHLDLKNSIAGRVEICEKTKRASLVMRGASKKLGPEEAVRKLKKTFGQDLEIYSFTF